MKLHHQSGTSLIEILLAAALASVVMFGVFKIILLVGRTQVYARARSDADASADLIVQKLRKNFENRDFNTNPNYSLDACLDGVSQDCAGMTTLYRYKGASGDVTVNLPFLSQCDGNGRTKLNKDYDFSPMQMRCLFTRCTTAEAPVVVFTDKDGNAVTIPKLGPGGDKAIGAVICAYKNVLPDGSTNSIQFNIELAFPTIGDKVSILKRTLSLPVRSPIGDDIKLLPN